MLDEALAAVDLSNARSINIGANDMKAGARRSQGERDPHIPKTDNADGRRSVMKFLK
jgi:hypothetical protein